MNDLKPIRSTSLLVAALLLSFLQIAPAFAADSGFPPASNFGNYGDCTSCTTNYNSCVAGCLLGSSTYLQCRNDCTQTQKGCQLFWCPQTISSGGNSSGGSSSCLNQIEQWYKNTTTKHWSDGSCFELNLGLSCAGFKYDNGHDFDCNFNLKGNGVCCIGLNWKVGSPKN